MKAATIVLFAIAAVLIVVGYFRGHVHVAGLKAGGKTFVEVLPILLASFAVAGLAQVLISREFIAKWLSEASGMKGILIGTFAGAVSAPGGPYISFPLVAAIYRAGAGIGPVVAFVTSWSLLAVTRVPLEVALIGPRVTLIRLASTFFFPPLAGLIAGTVFSRMA
jgi:uncharacterized membrane protein YraQ (UPF0718 family)